MLQLKHYQESTVLEIGEYAKQATRQGADVGFYALTHKAYKPLPGNLAPIPYVCVKVPTGGGKTLVAAHSVGEIFNNYLSSEVGLVLWIVPWESILTQTLNALKDKAHPYREVLDASFPSGVLIFTLREALFGQLKPQDLTDNLCVIVSTISAIRVEDREGRKVYESNGYLMTHFENVPPEVEPMLTRDESGLIIQSLENVIRLYNPLVVLDEGHNVQTPLSFDILARLNPAFALEYTATPREQSNILVDVPATALKEAQMVKIPLWLYNRITWQTALQDAKDQRDRLEHDAKAELKATHEYIRPILLIQAEPRSKEDPERITVERVHEFLLDELQIPPEQVAIKTGDKDELAGVKLFSEKCPVRYIVTVYALKEGWDCSFAYVLASVANLGKRVAVEQLIGRVLRLPQAIRKHVESLNYAYVYSYSPKFDLAAQAVIAGLMDNGYAPEDVRPGPVQERPSLDIARAIKDPEASIPKLAYLENSTWEELTWNHLFAGFRLPARDPDIKFVPPQEEKSALIDVKQEEIVVEHAHQLPLLSVINERPLNTEQLVNWLDHRQHDQYISQKDNREFISKVISRLIAEHGDDYLNELNRHKFHLRASLKQRIEEYKDDHCHKKLLGYKGTGLIASAGEVPYPLPPSIRLDKTYKGTFQRHLFEQAAPMNNEEAIFAVKLDALDNLLWWYRNREREDFHLQGWWGEFYPDFLAKTKKGVILILEYKGEHLFGAPREEEKDELGKLWEAVSDGVGRFWTVTKDNMDAVIAEIMTL